MTFQADWEAQLQRDLDEIRRSGAHLSTAAKSVRGRCEARGVSIEVDTAGNITRLDIAPGVMGWPPAQLSSTLSAAHAKAKADATSKTQELMLTADPQLRQQLEQLTAEPTATPQPPAMTEEEIQAADDAYFQSQNGW